MTPGVGKQISIHPISALPTPGVVPDKLRLTV